MLNNIKTKFFITFIIVLFLVNIYIFHDSFAFFNEGVYICCCDDDFAFYIGENPPDCDDMCEEQDMGERCQTNTPYFCDKFPIYTDREYACEYWWCGDMEDPKNKVECTEK